MDVFASATVNILEMDMMVPELLTVAGKLSVMLSNTVVPTWKVNVPYPLLNCVLNVSKYTPAFNLQYSILFPIPVFELPSCISQ